MIDITIDLETLSLSPTAAILQIAAIPWNREAEKAEDAINNSFTFEQKIDVRSCIKDGFTLDDATVKWWARQKQDVKDAVFSGECHSLKDSLEAFSSWVNDLRGDGDTVCLWAQGSDFDIAILRNAYSFYNLDFPFTRDHFRDARTYILEVGAMLMFPIGSLQGIPAKSVYENLDPMPGEKKDVHNAVFDAKQTTWNVFTIMHALHSHMVRIANAPAQD